MLGSVELERLHLGLRSALLLIFYLLVDGERVPIIPDQPEEGIVAPVISQSLGCKVILDCTANF
ncbi:hypothetical protein ABW53_01000 [Stutzerimonas stutzeri]|nr:hypothetical protein ABW53_01000 [Stutzerimonas stutzeri]